MPPRAPSDARWQSELRDELLKLKRMAPWPRIQDDSWDQASRFVYNVRTLDKLRLETRRVAAEMGYSIREFGSYVLHRWYNYHTHQAALDIVLAHERTYPEEDPFHHTVDFYLDGKGFDLKLSQFPRRYPDDLANARAYPEALAHWLYEHQSRQGRFHTANRLFVIFADTVESGRTWELRRGFRILCRSIHTFLDSPRLFRVRLQDEKGNVHRPFTGVIFCVREQSEP